MRVLHLTRDLPPRHHGGLSTAVGGLVRASAHHGLTVAVISFDDWRPARGGAAAPCAPHDEDGITVLRVTHADHLAAVHAAARAFAPHLVHVHHGMLWPLAAALRSALGVPAVKTVHVVQREMNALRGTAERTRSLAGQEAALAAADRIIVPSRAAAEALAPYGAEVAHRVRIAPHGIDDSAAACACSALRATQPARCALLAAGRFDHVKGTPELFAVLVRVLTARPEARAVVAGGLPANPRGEQQWRRRWLEVAPDPVRARVAFPGWLEPPALARHFRDASALLQPSRFETFGLAALEAMLHGVPVIATRAGALPELVTHDETGLLVPPGDADGLAAHSIALLDDPGRATRLGQTAAAAARAHHLWERRFGAVLAVYREVAA